MFQNIFSWNAIEIEPMKVEKKPNREDIDFSVEFDQIKINIPVDDFCRDHGLDSEFIDVLDDISSTAKFGKHFVPTCEGGFLRRWFNGEKFKDVDCDIDFFFVGINLGKDFSVLRQGFKDFLVNNYEGVLHSTNPDKNYDMTIRTNDKSLKAQLMSMAFCHYNSIDSHDLNYAIMKNILKFDNINSMIGYNAEKRTLVMHENFVKFNKDKIHVYNMSGTNTSHPIRVFDRFEKFVKDGYRQPDSTDYKIAMLKYIESKKSRYETSDNYE
jgi:hypothetical protein